MSDEMRELTFDDLLNACRPGGASVLTSVCQLAPAAGWSAMVAPPRYLRGKEATYSFARRNIDGAAATTVLLDSKGSQGNRREAAIAAAMTDEEHPAHSVVKRIPRLVLEFSGEGDEHAIRYLDLELPHRWVDGHVRAGTRDGKPVTADPDYRAMRNATSANVAAIFNTSPMSLIDGVWDSSRKSNQVRLRSAIVGEIFGVLADQESIEPEIPRKGGARVDPIAASVQLDGEGIRAIADRQRDELSTKTYTKIDTDSRRPKQKTNSGSVLGLGAVPPALTGLGGVACSRIAKNTVLSFASLRQLRFGGGAAQDAAFRALLAAVAILSMSLADEELYLRADCDLVEEGPRAVALDGRYGSLTRIEPIDAQRAISLLAEAMDHADRHGLSWSGQEFVVEGDASILRAAVEDETEGE